MNNLHKFQLFVYLAKSFLLSRAKKTSPNTVKKRAVSDKKAGIALKTLRKLKGRKPPSEVIDFDDL